MRAAWLAKNGDQRVRRHLQHGDPGAEHEKRNQKRPILPDRRRRHETQTSRRHDGEPQHRLLHVADAAHHQRGRHGDKEIRAEESELREVGFGEIELEHRLELRSQVIDQNSGEAPQEEQRHNDRRHPSWRAREHAVRSRRRRRTLSHSVSSPRWSNDCGVLSPLASPVSQSGIPAVSTIPRTFWPLLSHHSGIAAVIIARPLAASRTPADGRTNQAPHLQTAVPPRIASRVQRGKREPHRARECARR